MSHKEDSSQAYGALCLLYSSSAAENEIFTSELFSSKASINCCVMELLSSLPLALIMPLRNFLREMVPFFAMSDLIEDCMLKDVVDDGADDGFAGAGAGVGGVDLCDASVFAFLVGWGVGFDSSSSSDELSK